MRTRSFKCGQETLDRLKDLEAYCRFMNQSQIIREAIKLWHGQLCIPSKPASSKPTSTKSKAQSLPPKTPGKREARKKAR